MDFHHTSYHLHEKSYLGLEADENELELYKNWFDKGTVDVWRHLRMLTVLDPFIENDPHASWLTVGDGRFGTAAIYINRKGAEALATDIDDRLLKVAKDKGMIKSFQKENAEQLSFADNSFDYCFCKEAFHHFPRPHLALYEMLRVARKGVLLVEPNDWLPTPLPRRVLQLTKNSLKKLMGFSIPHPDTGCYEPEGNYVFTISSREFQKIALGMDLPAVAFKTFSDVYIKGVEHEEALPSSPLFLKIRRKLVRYNVLNSLGLHGHNMITAVLFKTNPAEKLVQNLRLNKMRFYTLPKNPYI